VLVVDDSAMVREVMQSVFAQERDIVVTAAGDPLIAESKMRLRRPDVIVLDLEMPRMDGLTFLRKIMAEDPIPVVICSGRAKRGTREALRAIDHGAVAVVEKPHLGVRGFLHESAVMLIDVVRGAATARVRPRGISPAVTKAKAKDRVGSWPRPAFSSPAVVRPAPRLQPDVQLIALGSSIGGTEALHEILGALTPDCPGVVAVQHMPRGFTQAFAAHLDETCLIDVKEAEDGDEIRPGRALIAPGDHHLKVVRRGTGYAVRVCDGPLVSRHRPSVDVLFSSVARAAGRHSYGAILTGMGDDGADGLLEMRKAGATTLAQDEESCVVFGMPKEAIARGAANSVLSLRAIADRLSGLRPPTESRSSVQAS